MQIKRIMKLICLGDVHMASKQNNALLVFMHLSAMIMLLLFHKKQDMKLEMHDEAKKVHKSIYWV